MTPYAMARLCYSCGVLVAFSARRTTSGYEANVTRLKPVGTTRHYCQYWALELPAYYWYICLKPRPMDMTTNAKLPAYIYY